MGAPGPGTCEHRGVIWLSDLGGLLGGGVAGATRCFPRKRHARRTRGARGASGGRPTTGGGVHRADGDRAAVQSLCRLRRETGRSSLWCHRNLFHGGDFGLGRTPVPRARAPAALHVQAPRLCPRTPRLLTRRPVRVLRGLPEDSRLPEGRAVWRGGVRGRCPRHGQAGWPARPGVWAGCSEDVPAILGGGQEAAPGWCEDRAAAGVLCRLGRCRPGVAFPVPVPPCVLCPWPRPFPPLCPSSARAWWLWARRQSLRLRKGRGVLGVGRRPRVCGKCPRDGQGPLPTPSVGTRPALVPGAQSPRPLWLLSMQRSIAEVPWGVSGAGSPMIDSSAGDAGAGRPGMPRGLSSVCEALRRGLPLTPP